jgi:alpha-ketoglutarate-dependent taurine dioxygenase
MQDAFELSHFGSEPLPLVLSPKGSATLDGLIEQIQAHRAALRERLLEHGGLLFRGFPVASAEDFSRVIDALETGKSVNYIGGDSPRHKVTGAVYTSTEVSPAMKIPLHNELSFVRHYPRHIFFFCEVEPADRGETIVADARRVVRALNPAVRDRFIERQLTYVSNYYGQSLLMDLINKIETGHKSWREVFETNDRAKVEALCRENDFAFEWYKDNWIRVSQTRPATLEHPETGELAWFCQPHLYDFNPRLLGWWRWVGTKVLYARRHMRLHEVFHADGSRIRRSDLYHIYETLDRNTIAFPWRRGDVLLLDNVLSMHGRAPFTGKRRVLAALTS